MRKLLGLELDLCRNLAVLGLALFLNLNCLHAGASRQATAPDTSGETAAEPASSLTIYNANFFVARELVPLDLKPGVNEASYAGVAAHLEPDSVILRDPGGRTLRI